MDRASDPARPVREEKQREFGNLLGQAKATERMAQDILGAGEDRIGMQVEGGAQQRRVD
jgi:hypothetical protein